MDQFSCLGINYFDIVSPDLLAQNYSRIMSFLLLVLILYVFKLLFQINKNSNVTAKIFSTLELYNGRREKFFEKLLRNSEIIFDHRPCEFDFTRGAWRRSSEAGVLVFDVTLYFAVKSIHNSC